MIEINKLASPEVVLAQKYDQQRCPIIFEANHILKTISNMIVNAIWFIPNFVFVTTHQKLR